ncbi:hydroxyphenylacetyl-CoA thioesterase PaaI [uncultured Nocardioides sp.]|uniref:Acyl-coenzyme A thioesterase PaaD (Pse.pu.) (E. coli PaaI) n=1 Tax=uncultured Nocardioides sp. TaxID=198441 RepID=A0A6J4P7H5_9ACTN|nr:hydroxyphenylacetyl-CoA thioesterase PaaI [uncultured Nocardioides sp.]CAA9404822.1 MAG: Acyl-coenzyme A thioesterase PaaD (Pse.pu.) (E. coli PaaI) [uncultured Nocardioides sp.]
MSLPEHIRRMWDGDRASRALGMTLVSVSPGRAEVSMPVREDMVNGHAIGHGGLTFTLADSAFAFACNSHGPVTVAHSASIRFHAPVRLGEVLTAVAVEREREGRRGVYDVDVHAGDRLVATFEGHATQTRTGDGS